MFRYLRNSGSKEPWSQKCLLILTWLWIVNLCCSQFTSWILFRWNVGVSFYYFLFSGFHAYVELVLGGTGAPREEKGVTSNCWVVVKGFQANSDYWVFPRKMCSPHWTSSAEVPGAVKDLRISINSSEKGCLSALKIKKTSAAWKLVPFYSILSFNTVNSKYQLPQSC